MHYKIPDSIVEGGSQVFSYQVNGRRVFVKKRRPGKNIAAWAFQKLLYRLSGFILVLPPDRPARNNVEFEVAMLRRMEEQGIRVPKVLYVADEYFVMSDAGKSLEVEMRENRPKAREYMEKAVRELRRFHDLGLAHGGAQIKNFTVLNGDIFFIDFEEKIPQQHLGKFQLRDLFLFIFSLERTGHDPDLTAICGIYDGHENGATLDGIRRALLELRVVKLCDWSMFSRWRMRDIRSLRHLVGKAEGIGPL